MYTILVNNSNELVTTVKNRIIQRSKLVDNLHFLVEPYYNELDMSTFTVMMEYVLPISREYKTETLTKSDALYKDMLEYKLPIDTNITKEHGKVEIQLTFTKSEMDAYGNIITRVRKTSKCSITIIPITAWSDYVVDSDLTAIDQRLIQLELMANQLNDLTQYAFENKADNIVYNEEENTLQLSANGELIGDKIVINISSSENINAIKKIEIDPDGIMTAIYADDTTEVIGKVSGKDCVGVYVPSLVDPDKLTFTLQDKPGDPEIVIDIDRSNEWSSIEDSSSSNYVWEYL